MILCLVFPLFFLPGQDNSKDMAGEYKSQEQNYPYHTSFHNGSPIIETCCPKEWYLSFQFNHSKEK